MFDMIVSTCDELPGIAHVIDNKRSTTHFLKMQDDGWYCYSCQTSFPCDHIKAVISQTYEVPEYDPWHEVGKMLHKLVNVCCLITPINVEYTSEITKSLIEIERELEILTQWRLRERERSL